MGVLPAEGPYFIENLLFGGHGIAVEFEDEILSFFLYEVQIRL